MSSEPPSAFEAPSAPVPRMQKYVPWSQDQSIAMAGARHRSKHLKVKDYLPQGGFSIDWAAILLADLPFGGVDVFARAEGGLQRINGSVSKQEGWASMIENTSCDSSVSSPTAVESLKMLLDYAIVEGSELRLPVFVLLLRMANLELAKSARRGFRLNSDSPSVREADERIAP